MKTRSLISILAVVAAAVVAMTLVLGGSAEAKRLISGKSIKKNSITSKQIKDGTITAADIAAGTIPGVTTGVGAAGSAGSAGASGAAGAKGEKGEKGDPGDDGAPGAALASGMIDADGDTSRVYVGGVSATGGVLVNYTRRLAVQHTAGSGYYCVTVQTRGGILDPWVDYVPASSAGHVAMVTLNGSAVGFVRQYTSCGANGYDIRTSGLGGGAADLAFNIAIH